MDSTPKALQRLGEDLSCRVGRVWITPTLLCCMKVAAAWSEAAIDLCNLSGVQDVVVIVVVQVEEIICMKID